jgi:hypothetical protein
MRRTLPRVLGGRRWLVARLRQRPMLPVETLKRRLGAGEDLLVLD